MNKNFHTLNKFKNKKKKNFSKISFCLIAGCNLNYEECITKKKKKWIPSMKFKKKCTRKKYCLTVTTSVY